jgi:NADPH-dependent ferric siderophore reductase
MTTTAAPALPMILDEVEVVAVHRLSTSFVRVELGGPALADLADPPYFDQRIKLIFPTDDGRLPSFADARAETWWDAWLALPEDQRGHLRTYSVRAVHGTGSDTRLVVDLVLHLADEASGPAARWASTAVVGDRVVLVAPRRGFPFGGIEFAPGEADRLLLVGDETAVPAISSILGDLPVDAVGKAYLEVPTPDDVLDLRAPAGVRVVWLPRHDAPHGDRLCRAVHALFGLDDGDDRDLAVDPDLWETPTYSSSGESVDPTEGTGGGLYAWVAGEAGTVTRLRRHLVRDAGLDRRQVAFMGYWRIGVAMR